MPQSEFDTTVLDLIENSPVGAVPHTPAYDDAIRRLSAARQIYPDADHRDGYVTARSLARLPAFLPANWEAFVHGRIPAELLETNTSVYNRYTGFLLTPLRARAEAARAHVAGKPLLHRAKAGPELHDPLHALFLVPGTGPNRALPGNYLFGFVVQLQSTAGGGSWVLDVHDSDDASARFEGRDLTEAAAKLGEVIESAPFHLDELEGLGFTVTT